MVPLKLSGFRRNTVRIQSERCPACIGTPSGFTSEPCPISVGIRTEGADDGGRSANSLMAQWNLRLYPCLWRRLSRRHQRRLKSIVL